MSLTQLTVVEAPTFRFNVYFGCALTSSPKRFQKKVEALKNVLRPHCNILDFVGLVGGTCEDVYHHDIHNCIGRCDLFVAICDYAAIGLGWELGAQVEARKMPTLAVASKKSRVSRLVKGPVLPHYKFVEYEDMTDVFGLVIGELKAMSTAKKRELDQSPVLNGFESLLGYVPAVIAA